MEMGWVDEWIEWKGVRQTAGVWNNNIVELRIFIEKESLEKRRS